MIVTYGLSNLDLYFSDLDDTVLVIYTNEITDDLILSIDDLLLSSHIEFKVSVGENFVFNVSLSVWEKLTENIKSIIFSGILIDNQFTYQHMECMKCLENLFIEKINHSFLYNDEIKSLSNIKRICINGNYLY